MEKEAEKSRIAASVMEAGRNQLFFAYRYLEQAIFRLRRKENGEIRIGSDGDYLYYERDYVLNRYLQDSSELAGDYLHTVIHCLYQHPFFGRMRKREYWDLAADMAAEYIRTEMIRGKETREDDRVLQCRSIMKEAEKEMRTLSAQNLYTWLDKRYGGGEEISGRDISELKSLFARDDHGLWYHERKGGENQNQWKEIAENIILTIQGFSFPASGQGEQAGRLVRSLQAVTREKQDYGDFLKKFARPEERLQTNEEEFDYIYYTYGLRVLGRMPLIEPLEYKEAWLVREFIIAVDTSGSCEGKLVESFLTKTYNILKQTESFSSKVNIHILQCDAGIQEDKKIESPKELEDYIEGLTLKGFGGTDFRPVFQYVEDLKAAGELKRMGGLVYFTDGYGVFPAVPPKYRTVFAFVNREDDVKVPPWAMKIYLDEEGLR